MCYFLKRFQDYLETEQKMWDDTSENNLEYLRTLYAKEKYEKALREKVRRHTRFSGVNFAYS